MTAKAPPKRAEAFEWTWRGAHLPGALTRQGTGPHALLIWGEETPRKSGAKMEALAAAAGVTPTVLPYGKLGLHEEFAGDVAQAVFERPSHQNEGAKDDD